MYWWICVISMVNPSLFDEFAILWVYAIRGEIEEIEFDLPKSMSCVVIVQG